MFKKGLGLLRIVCQLGRKLEQQNRQFLAQRAHLPQKSIDQVAGIDQLALMTDRLGHLDREAEGLGDAPGPAFPGGLTM